MEQSKKVKNLVNEKVTRHDSSCGTIPTPCGAKGTSERASFVTLLASKLRGSSCASEASYKCRGGVNSSIDSQNPSPQPSPARGEGACHSNSENSQNLIKVKNLKTYRLNVLTTLRKTAFTLAEVLITLGVIGIVAAMTIPTLVNNYQEKVTITKLKKAYSLINNAYQLAKIDNGEFGTWFSISSGVHPDEDKDEDGNPILGKTIKQNSDIIWDRFEPYLKVASRCKASDTTCEKYDTVYTLDGTKRPDGYTKSTALLNLNDGTTLGYGYVHTINCTNEEACGDFWIDINGYKTGPNTLGKDIFGFTFLKDSIVPGGQQNLPSSKTRYCDIKNYKDKTNGYSCTAWVIQFENMDYLKCPDELSWDGKHKCSD